MIRSLSVLSAGVVALAMSGAANADNDLMRLDGKGDAEVQETRYYGGGFRGGIGYGGYRGGFGYGGYRGFGYGGYRGFGGYYGRGYGYGYGRGYGGYYRPYYGFGLGLGLGLGYANYYGGYGGYGGGYGGYYNSYYSTPYYSTPYYSSSYGPCTCATSVIYPSDASVNFVTPNALQIPGDGTFPYNGGPQDGISVPAGMPNRTNAPRDGHLVSVPAPSSGYHFLAFGEQPAPADQRPETGNSSDLLRVSYPAYGEAPTGFSGGTTIYPPHDPLNCRFSSRPGPHLGAIFFIP